MSLSLPLRPVDDQSLIIHAGVKSFIKESGCIDGGDIDLSWRIVLATVDELAVELVDDDFLFIQVHPNLLLPFEVI
jgi:hypothetical protein